MRRTGLSWLAAGVLVTALASCFKDPVTSLQSTSASRLLLTSTTPSGPIGQLSNVTITARPDTDIISIQALDPQGNYLSFGAPTFATADPTIATVVAYPDSTIGHVPGSTLWKALVIAGANFGTTNVMVTAAGVTDTIAVVTLPVAFTGTISPANAHASDTVTISAPAGLSFGAAAAATFGAGPNFLVSRSASALKYIAGAALSAGKVAVSGVVMNGIALPTLTSTATLTVTDNLFPGDTTAAAAINMGTLNKPGDSLVTYGSVNGSEAALYLKFTLDTTSAVQVYFAFLGTGGVVNNVYSPSDQNPDNDIVICTNSNCTYGTDLAGNAAAATNNPETGTSSSIVGSAGAPTTVYLRIYPGFGTTSGVSSFRVRVKL